jgi:hypothetical protein
MQQPPNSYPQYPQPQWQQPQQQPNYPRPQTYYPPQQQRNPQQQWNQQQPYPPKKSRKGLFIILGVVLAVALFGCIGVAAMVNAGGQAAQQALNQTSTQVAQLPTTQATTQPTAQTTQPTAQAKWSTVQTITGNGSKKTAIFTAPDDWKILYSCTYQNIGGVTADGVLTVMVYGSDGSIIDPSAIIATCKNGVAKTAGETEEHQGGQVYLDVNGTGGWTIQVQELK